MAITIGKEEQKTSVGKLLPNELIATLIEFIPDDFVYKFSTKFGKDKLNCIEPSNSFEYFLKNQFIKVHVISIQ